MLSRVASLAAGAAFWAANLFILVVLHGMGWIDASLRAVVLALVGRAVLRAVVLTVACAGARRIHPVDVSLSAEAELVASRMGAVPVPVSYRPDTNSSLEAMYLPGADVIVVDDEVARLDPVERHAVLAHELAHRNHAAFIVARGVTTVAAKAMLVALAFWGHGFWGTLGLLGVYQLAVTAISVVGLALQRACEHDADRAARRAGFGPALAAVLHRHFSVSAESWRWLRTHPRTAIRFANLTR